MNPFTYTPLDPNPSLRTIRLLELQPGNTGDPLECSLVEASLAANPDFEAISYCWGSNKVAGRIICDHGTYLSVHQSLGRALKRFRFADRARWLWADAICINQSDTDEKGDQVNRMRDIYFQARRVLVWLGDLGQGETFQSLIDVARKTQATEPSLVPKDHAARQEYFGFSDTHVLLLAALLSRAWFRRVWIVQEVALARDAVLYCGTQSLAWGELCALLTLDGGINIIGPNDQVAIDIVGGIRAHQEAIGKGSPATLLGVLLHHRPSLATNPRDKVYGFLGLCTDDVVQANYRSDPLEVYELLTKRYLLKDGNLQIITAPSNPRSPRPDALPSWVPDWGATDVASPLALRSEISPEDGYDATRESKWTPRLSHDGDMLGVEAQFVDEITELGPARKPYRPVTPDAKSLFKQLRAELVVSSRWHKICLGDASGWDDAYLLTGETLFDVCWQILLAGCRPSDTFWRNKLHLTPLWAFGLMDSLAKMTGSTIFLRRVLAAAVADDFQVKVRRDITYRRMMRTKKGYLGLAPSFARVGDRIAVLKGLSTPVVLRQREVLWELVGECYVDGIMHGEVFQSECCKDIWLA